MNHPKFLDIAFKIAQEAPRTTAALVAALVVDKNTIVSVGINSSKTHPFVAKYKIDPWLDSLHAETTAIKKAITTISSRKLSKCLLYVCRARKIDGEFVWGLSRPCENCQKFMRQFPPKLCIYSTNETGVYDILN